MTGILMRFVAWHVRTYGRWAYRHEPYSFAIYPVLAALGPLIWWLTIGRLAALVLLAVFEGLTLLIWGWMLRRRKRLNSRESL
jgi:hypothetical protein